jgi:dolichol kinase
VHAAVLGFVLLAPVLGRWGMAGVALAALAANALLLPRTAFGKALARDGEPRWNGLLSYPLAVALGYALFGAETGSLAWAVLALGDPAASLAGGARPRSARIPWNRRKSLAGTAAFAAAAAAGVVAVGCLALPGGPVPPGAGLLGAAAAMALAGALAETLPIPPDDNLPILLAAGGARLLLAAVAGPAG